MERKLFYKTRAAKIGYIIDHNVPLEEIKNIMISNFNFIGGRYNQFFLLENNDFSEEDYERLQEFDADFYVALCDITEDLIDIITTRFSPLEILKRNQITILPGEIKFHGGILYKNPSSLYVHKYNIVNSDKINYINFKVNQGTDAIIKEILLFNFGFPFDPNGWFQNIPKKDISIGDYNSLKVFLNDYNGEKYYFKNILSQASYQKFGGYKPEDMSVCLIVGNTLDDYLYFWNRNIVNSDWESFFLNTFILPIDKIEGNEELINGMMKFIQTYANSRGRYKVSLHSCKFSVKELLTKVNLYSRLYEKSIYDDVIYSTDWYINYKNRDFVTLREKENFVDLNLGLGNNFISLEEGFITDVFLEYDTGEYTENSLGFEGSPLLGNRNNSAFKNIFYETKYYFKECTIPIPLRINKSRSFSLFRTKVIPKDNIYIIIPDANEILKNIVQSEITSKIPEYDLMTPIATQKNKFYNFANISISKQGIRANTIFKLFGYNLGNLASIILNENRRKFFIEYNQSIKENDMISKIDQVIENNSKVKANKKLNNSELSKKIYLNVRNFYNPTGKYLLFNRILKDLGISNDLISKYYYDKTLSLNNFTEEEKNKILEIKGRLQFLINNGIILLGISFSCNNCSENYRIPINEVSDKIRCKCCGNIQPISVEENWAYSFNSLLKGTEVIGAFSVLQYLIKLASELQHSSFLYSLGVDFKKKDDTGNEFDSITDGDILALIQGYLVLCEVKNSWDLLGEKDFEGIEEVAKKIRPDVIVFSSYGKPSVAKLHEINRWIHQLKRKLSKYRIDVKLDTIENDILKSFIVNPYLPI